MAVHAERAALHADLMRVPSDMWATPSLCAGWEVHDVVAHIIDSSKTTRLGFIRRMIASGLDFDRDNEVGVHRERRPTTHETLAELSRVVASTRTPPAPAATRLVEAVVHGEDIRRPLGIWRDYPIAHVLPALRHQLTTSVSMGGGREHATGYRVEAADADFVSGSGPDVRGRAIDILLAVSGRPVDASTISGSGAPAFTRSARSGS